jgi:hypothetical protein
MALAACNSQPDPSTATAPAAVTAGPATPTAHIPTVVVPTASGETGVVTGRILIAATGAPMAGVRVYLAERVFLTPGPDYVISLTEQGSPHTTADVDGFFALAAPPSDHYSLVVWTAVDSRVVADPNDTTKELSVQLAANQTLELGDLTINWP